MGLQAFPQTYFFVKPMVKAVKYISESYFCSGQNLSKRNTKKYLMDNLKAFTFPAVAKCEKITIFTKNSHLGHKTRQWGL